MTPFAKSRIRGEGVNDSGRLAPRATLNTGARLAEWNPGEKGGRRGERGREREGEGHDRGWAHLHTNERKESGDG